VPEHEEAARLLKRAEAERVAAVAEHIRPLAEHGLWLPE
jgi:hypothetical protein